MRKQFFAYSKHAIEEVGLELAKQVSIKGVPAIICLGTDKVLADSLGALVGSELVKKNLPTFVYGTLERTVTLNNIEYAVKFARAMHPTSPIWVVDASTSYDNRFGVVTITDKFNPFISTDGQSDLQAELFITATVSQARERVLYGARLREVVQIANVVSNSIEQAIINQAKFAY